MKENIPNIYKTGYNLATSFDFKHPENKYSIFVTEDVFILPKLIDFIFLQFLNIAYIVSTLEVSKCEISIEIKL